MGAEGPLDRQAVHELGPGPALRGPQDQHRPASAGSVAGPTCRALDVARSRRGTRRAPPPSAGAPPRGLAVEAALDQHRAVAVARRRAPGARLGDPGQHRRVRRSCSRSDGGSAAPRRRAPDSGTCSSASPWPRARLGLAVADHAGDDEVRVVEGRAERVAQARSPARHPRGSTRASRAAVARDAAGKENWRNSRAIPSASRATCGYSSL